MRRFFSLHENYTKLKLPLYIIEGEKLYVNIDGEKVFFKPLDNGQVEVTYNNKQVMIDYKMDLNEMENIIFDNLIQNKVSLFHYLINDSQAAILPLIGELVLLASLGVMILSIPSNWQKLEFRDYVNELELQCGKLQIEAENIVQLKEEYNKLSEKSLEVCIQGKESYFNGYDDFFCKIQENALTNCSFHSRFN